MKIYPNSSNIVVTNNVNTLTDIPLSYIDTQKLEYRINTTVEQEFNTKIKQEILPYDKMNNSLICLFDKLGNQIDYEELTRHFKREGNDYIFVPYNSTMFNPRTFEYNVVAKKNILYNSKMMYNMNAVATADRIANILMPIFGDAPNRGVAPSNIFINNGSMSYGDLIVGNLNKKDLVFLELESLDSDFQKDRYMDYRANVFSFVSSTSASDELDSKYVSDKVKFYKQEEKKDFRLKKPMIYENLTFSSNEFFNVPNNTESIVYHNLFDASYCPILLEEHLGKGFVVYMSSSIYESLIDNSSLLYEMMFYVYSKAYLKTDKYSEWITDSIPDYIVVNNALSKKDRFISHLQLHKMFGLGEYEVTPYEIIIDKERFPYVRFTGMNKNYLTFEKITDNDNEVFKDPVKPSDAISIFTSRQNTMYFNDFLYKINDNLAECIKVEKINNTVNVTVRPFRHSASGIYIKTLTSLDIPLSYRNEYNANMQITNADYYLVCKQNESASYLNCIDSHVYKKDDGLILATIQIRQDSTSTFVYDMRQRGGGLPEGEKDNFNCFDIGHIYGRPYRKGGTFIVTLPKKLEKHKEVIEATVRQYCAAEEYPIVIFKED